MAKTLYNFMIDADLAAGLKKLKARDGIPEAEQVRRALRLFLKRHGALAPTRAVKAAKKGSSR